MGHTSREAREAYGIGIGVAVVFAAVSFVHMEAKSTANTVFPEETLSAINVWFPDSNPWNKHNN